ncbi:unnamed protein product [Symbiodinium sp. CCMP2592]|nr:unnamed protein product [Symbiodinium sp. CCMP2592]
MVKRNGGREPQARKTKKPKHRRGGREALSVEQVIHFYFVLLRDVNCAFAAVMFVLGLMLGERAELLCNMQDTWFAGLDASHGQLPTCTIRPVNKKTKCREVPLESGFGQVMWQWVTGGKPLLGGQEGEDRTQWPHQGQMLFQPRRTRRIGKQQPGRYLFPGRTLGGNNVRAWRTPITTRGFFGKFQAAQAVIVKQLQQARQEGQRHPFDGIDIKK